MTGVELQHLTKVFDKGVCAVADLNLSIRMGELLVLVGASGSGKTTALRLIAGLEQPTAGQVSLAGRDITRLPPWQRDVALVFQQPALYPHLNVAANLRFSLEHRQRPHWLRRWLQPRCRRVWQTQTKILNERVAEVARQLSVTALLDRYPAQLSGGEQQRVALGRALVRQPAVLLLDEPFSHLDTQLRQEMRSELHLLHRRLPATIVCVTHDPQEALALGDRVAVLHEGVLQQIAEPMQLLQEPAHRFIARFLGWPERNFLEGVLLFEQEKLYFVRGEWRWPLPARKMLLWSAFVGQAVILGLPPESVRVGSGNGFAMEMDVVQLEGCGAGALVTWQTRTLQLQGRLSETLDSGTLVQGQKQMVYLQLEKAQLFDCRTGRVLTGARTLT